MGLKSYAGSEGGIVILTVIDVGWFAIGARGVDPNDIVGTGSNQLGAIGSIGEKGWTIGI